jgi:general secretion pathway protein A
MYEAHFGLKNNPFYMTPDPSALYWTTAHREALAGLTYAIVQNKGFVVLTGPAGTGKTTLLRKLLDSAPVPMRTSIVYNPTLTANEFLELALADFDMPRVPMNKAQRLMRLEQFLLSTHRDGKAAVLIIDEAHKLSPELLEEVRLLTNFETARQKLLQIVLVGQPELNGILNREDLWQLKQRIAVRLQIQPLSEADVPLYLHFRWTKAGGAEPFPFQPAAIELITAASKGIPRMINGICDNALISAYGAGRKVVDQEDILEVIHDLDLRSVAVIDAPRNGTAVPVSTPITVGKPSIARGTVKTNGAIVHRKPAGGVVEEASLLSRLGRKLGIRTRRAEITE